MAITANPSPLTMIQRVNECPTDQENLKALAKTFLTANYAQLLLPKNSPVIGELNLKRAPLVWSRLRSPYKETFIAALLKHHISINNHFSEGVLDFLSYLTEEVTHSPSEPSDGQTRLRDGRMLDENGYDSDGDYHGSSDEEIETYEPYTGPRDEISHDQQRVLGYINTYFRYVRKLVPHEYERVNQLSESEIVEWLESAQKLHFCALMCFTDQQGQTGIPLYQGVNRRTFNETIQCQTCIPCSISTNDERDLDRGHGGIEECRGVLHMFANNPFDTSDSSGTEIVEHTKNLIRMALAAIYDHNGLSTQTKEKIRATTDISLVFAFF